MSIGGCQRREMQSKKAKGKSKKYRKETCQSCFLEPLAFGILNLFGIWNPVWRR
jgi:hypothetical protein